VLRGWPGEARLVLFGGSAMASAEQYLARL
jgi:hypothetical protein